MNKLQKKCVVFLTYVHINQVICIRDLNEGYNAWKQWLTNKKVPWHMRYSALTAEDEEKWTPLHYASRFYRPDLLDIALKLESGEETGRHTSIYVTLYNIQQTF